MSLDLLACKIVKQSQANAVYWVSGEYAAQDVGVGKILQQFQPSGVIPVYQTRIGRNCMNKEWYEKWELAQSSIFDAETPDLDLRMRVQAAQMIVITPTEVVDKIIPWLNPLMIPPYYDDNDGHFIRMTILLSGGYDFLYISW